MSLLARIPLTIRHGIRIPEVSGVDSLDEAGWDVLRGSDTAFGFSAAESQHDVTPRARAERGAEIARGLGARKVCSYGVGTGLLERELLDLGFDLTVTEFAPETVERLKAVFPSVAKHDLRDGPLAGFDLHLLHRVDTELSDSEWRRYFAAVAEPHLMVMSQFLDRERLRSEMAIRVKRRGERIEAGWFRTEARMRALLPSSARRVDVFDLVGFLMSPS